MAKGLLHVHGITFLPLGHSMRASSTDIGTSSYFPESTKPSFLCPSSNRRPPKPSEHLRAWYCMCPARSIASFSEACAGTRINAGITRYFIYILSIIAQAFACVPLDQQCPQMAPDGISRCQLGRSRNRRPEQCEWGHSRQSQAGQRCDALVASVRPMSCDRSRISSRRPLRRHVAEFLPIHSAQSP